MSLLPALIAVGLLQIWPAGNPLQRDAGFDRLLAALDRVRALRRRSWWHLGAALSPALALAVVWLQLPALPALALSVATLLYSFGRGAFAPGVGVYLLACERGDLAAAAHSAGVERTGRSWAELHNGMLQGIAYQGLERLFAVVFWFALLGPGAALAYRLLFLYCERRPAPASRAILDACEWLPARLLAASFTVTGNFEGARNRLRLYLSRTEGSSGALLADCALGALSLDDRMMQSCDASEREIAAIKALYGRTLWLWLGAIGALQIVVWALVY